MPATKKEIARRKTHTNQADTNELTLTYAATEPRVASCACVHNTLSLDPPVKRHCKLINTQVIRIRKLCLCLPSCHHNIRNPVLIVLHGAKCQKGISTATRSHTSNKLQRLLSNKMKPTGEVLAALRGLMANLPKGLGSINAYIIPSDDAHQSEYLAKRDERRAFISGFDGSAGTAVVTEKEALLWTDGRYFQQAGKQLDSNWTLMKDGQPTTPSIDAWLARVLQPGSKVGVDANLISTRAWNPLNTSLKSAGCSLLPISPNLIDLVWADQPAAPQASIIPLELEFTGESVAQKLAAVREKMQDKRASVLVVSALDEIAWFLNLRGSDIDYNPVFFSDGTTDVTRTMHFGTPSEQEINAFTHVLKGQIALGTAIFPRKVKGQFLDTIARKALWDAGLDYGHGTGHGIGHFLNVHEGPMGIGIRLMPDDPGLEENMFLSNEPGYYKEGQFGIRIEDIVQVVSTNIGDNFDGRGALTFRTVTMCPIQTKLINVKLLTDRERNALNNYHTTVWETLSPLLKNVKDAETLAWLERETQPI
ncbi:xaa-Pro aminopeptidase 1 [Culex quinquefasciatus]|uniref:Xaa-Pro aminopeptidase 1 n=1 Tax=Culex quinquefasciatus TaxID=7176 RepID=B0WH45_CULQU|nr:xaa-Pro aminopeptidase 1 [Culex quinquefasciatus]|eukprot:XP_001848029.1 xaa-Pro aminopeptidase 1 [Culex quinquefasciatus]